MAEDDQSAKDDQAAGAGIDGIDEQECASSGHEEKAEGVQEQQDIPSEKDDRAEASDFCGEQDKGNVSASTQRYRKWPSIYKECRVNLAASTLVYALADMRKAIRKGKITEPEIIEELMNFPSSAESVLPMIIKHKELLLKEVVGEDEFYIDLMISDRELRRSQLADGEQEDGLILLEMDDENNNNEIVWAIGLDQ